MHQVTIDRVLQQRSMQSERLLEEFPFLWGVRQKWSWERHKISVATADKDFQEFLTETSPDPNIEVWLYLSLFPFQFEVKRLQWNSKRRQYATLMRDYCVSPESRVLNVILVQEMGGKDPSSTEDKTLVRIYRPPHNMLMDSFLQTLPETI